MDESFDPSHELNAKMGFELLEATPERVVGRMPVDGNRQPAGLWHGGASCVLAESLGSIGSHLFGQAHGGLTAVGTELNATHHRPAFSGWVTGTATAIHLGATATSYEIVLVDDHDKRICTARLSCRLITPRNRD